MELLSITLAANETKQFAKAGRYFEIIESSVAVTVNFTGANGALSDSMTNALSGLFLEDPYSHFAITNGASAQTITVLLMESGRGGSRRQPGNVRVIDSSAEKTAGLKQFYTGLGLGVHPAQLAYIWVRGLPGTRLAVKGLFLQSAVAGLVSWGTATPGGTVFTGAGVFALGNKYVGAAVSAGSTVGQAYGTSAAYPPGAGELTGFVQRGTVLLPANAITPMPLTTPFIVDAGNLLVFASTVVNRDLLVTFDAEEL